MRNDKDGICIYQYSINFTFTGIDRLIDELVVPVQLIPEQQVYKNRTSIYAKAAYVEKYARKVEEQLADYKHIIRGFCFNESSGYGLTLLIKACNETFTLLASGDIEDIGRVVQNFNGKARGDITWMIEKLLDVRKVKDHLKDVLVDAIYDANIDVRGFIQREHCEGIAVTSDDYSPITPKQYRYAMALNIFDNIDEIYNADSGTFTIPSKIYIYIYPDEGERLYEYIEGINITYQVSRQLADRYDLTYSNAMQSGYQLGTLLAQVANSGQAPNKIQFQMIELRDNVDKYLYLKWNTKYLAILFDRMAYDSMRNMLHSINAPTALGIMDDLAAYYDDIVAYTNDEIDLETLANTSKYKHVQAAVDHLVDNIPSFMQAISQDMRLIVESKDDTEIEKAKKFARTCINGNNYYVNKIENLYKDYTMPDALQETRDDLHIYIEKMHEIAKQELPNTDDI